MASDVEHVIEEPRLPSPKPLKGDLERKWTAFGQGLCGLVAIGLGIALYPIKPDESSTYDTRTFDIVANGSFGIWCGLIFVAAGVAGLIKRRQKGMVSTYLALSLANLVFAAVILVAVSYGITATVESEWYPGCTPSRNYRNYSCCVDKSRCRTPVGITVTTLLSSRPTYPRTTITTPPGVKTVSETTTPLSPRPTAPPKTGTSHPTMGTVSKTAVGGTSASRGTDSGSPSMATDLTTDRDSVVESHPWVHGSDFYPSEKSYESEVDSPDYHFYQWESWYKDPDTESKSYHPWLEWTTPPAIQRPPRAKYNSAECRRARTCLQKVKETMIANRGVYGGLVVVSITEVFISLYAAVFALIAICSESTFCCSWSCIVSLCRQRPREIVYVAYPLSQVANQAEEQPLVQSISPLVGDIPQQMTERSPLQPEPHAPQAELDKDEDDTMINVA